MEKKETETKDTKEDMMLNKGKEKEKSKEHKPKNTKSRLMGISIVRVAAFSFAIVSWYATSAGLSDYVFESRWQSGLISFGIQALLFVLNLKLPFYFNRIGEKEPNREKKKYLFGDNKGQYKQSYKMTAYQRMLIVFYIAVIVCSSFFSFIYICNHVVYKHQSGYSDDNSILTLSYRSILNDTDVYVTENTKAMQILASKLLGELKEVYPSASDSKNPLSLEELKVIEKESQDDYDIADDEYESANGRVEFLQKEIEAYQENIINTEYHSWWEFWERKKEEAQEELKEARKILKENKEKRDTAKKNLTKAKNDVENYKKTQDTIITEFLLEMLKATPSIEVLEQDIKDLNDTIVELGESDSIVQNYADLVGRTQTLTIVVKDYISLINASKAKGENSIEYLLEHVMDDVIPPDPSQQQESFSKDCLIWRNSWNIKLNALENIIQHLPRFSRAEKERLSDSMIDIDILSHYVADDKIEEIEMLRRTKVSDINIIEKVSALLVGKYWFTAWFSLALAIFFDVSSLLSGLFIYGVSKNANT